MIDPSVVIATAQQYTLQELKDLRAKALKELAEGGSSITSVSTGGGASYSRSAPVDVQQRVELYQRAIEYRTGVSGSDLSQESYPVFIRRY